MTTQRKKFLQDRSITKRSSMVLMGFGFLAAPGCQTVAPINENLGVQGYECRASAPDSDGFRSITAWINFQEPNSSHEYPAVITLRPKTSRSEMPTSQEITPESIDGKGVAEIHDRTILLKFDSALAGYIRLVIDPNSKFRSVASNRLAEVGVQCLRILRPQVASEAFPRCHGTGITKGWYLGGTILKYDESCDTNAVACHIAGDGTGEWKVLEKAKDPVLTLKATETGSTAALNHCSIARSKPICRGIATDREGWYLDHELVAKDSKCHQHILNCDDSGPQVERWTSYELIEVSDEERSSPRIGVPQRNLPGNCAADILAAQARAIKRSSKLSVNAP